MTKELEIIRRALGSLEASAWDRHYGKGITAEYANAVQAEAREALAAVEPLEAERMQDKLTEAQLRGKEYLLLRATEFLEGIGYRGVLSEDAAKAWIAERQSDTARLLNVARGCHDYGGGYRDGRDPEIFHHGIQTVINALEAAAKNDANDGQINVLERVGRAAIESTKESA